MEGQSLLVFKYLTTQLQQLKQQQHQKLILQPLTLFTRML